MHTDVILCVCLYLQLYFLSIRNKIGIDRGNQHIDKASKGEYRSLWMDQELLDTTYVFSNKEFLDNTFIEVSDSSVWGVLPPESDKGLCSKYEWCVFPIYKCLFSRIGFLIPIN